MQTKLQTKSRHHHHHHPCRQICISVSDAVSQCSGPVRGQLWKLKELHKNTISDSGSMLVLRNRVGPNGLPPLQLF